MAEEGYAERMREACARIVEGAADAVGSRTDGYEMIGFDDILDIAKWVASDPEERPTKEEFMGAFERSVRSALGDALMSAVEYEEEW